MSPEVAAAYVGKELRFGPDYLIPTPFDSRLILRIAPAVAQAAADSVTKIARAGGMTREQTAAIRAQILGIAKRTPTPEAAAAA